MTDGKATKESIDPVQDAPDPDEDDLDDLDEVLDEFSSTKISEPAPKDAKSAGQTSQASTTTVKSDQSEAQPNSTSAEDSDFTKQLQAGMAEMMRELESNPDMAKEFEQIMMGQMGMADEASKSAEDDFATKSVQQASSPPSDSSRSASTAHPANGQPTPQAGPAPSFQDTIRQTMNRMNESNASASASAANVTPGQNPDDFMTAMLNEIAQSQGGADGNSEDAFSNMLMGMMEQLTNKDILYEPMKDLTEKYPDWLAEREPGKPKASSITDEERKNYKEQQALVKEIVGRFERTGYSDQNTEDREFIVERMQQMQAAGSPPQDLVGDMGGAAEMLGGLDSQCPQQ